MRRVLLALVATTFGLVLLFSYKTQDPTRLLARRPAVYASSPAGPTVTAERHATTTVHHATPTTGHTTTTRARSTIRQTTTTRRAASTTTRAPARQVATGPVVNTQYGPVQVRVTLQSGRIVDVAALQLPSDRSRSVEISNAAAPRLRDEALAVQSANIDVVSGATYTSKGYIQSLQAALDGIHAG